MPRWLNWIEQIVSTDKVGSSILSRGAKFMLHFLSTLIRKYLIKNPHKMCDWCLSEYTCQVPKGTMLCNKCEKKYIKMNKKHILS